MTCSSESEAPEVCVSRLIPDTSTVLSSDPGNGKSSSKKKQKKRRQKGIHICDFDGCLARFSRPYRLAAHRAVHLGQKPFPCDYPDCDRAYTSSYHLRRHKISSHTEVPSEETYKCHYPGCLKEFKFVQNVKKHYRRTHMEKTCKECGKQFFNHIQLKKHIITHASGLPFECQQCNVKFPHKFLLRRHERGHRLHVCPVKGCYQEHRNWSNLRKHIASHPKDFCCFYCKKGYRFRKHLKTHILLHLSGKKRKPYELKKFACDICHAELLGKGSLKRHIKNIHETDRKKKPSPPRVKPPRAPRKDKGIPKRALAVVLSEVVVPKEVEADLIKASCDSELPSEIILDQSQI